MKNVSIYEAKMQLSLLLARARAGEEITITKSGIPIAKLVPASPVDQDELGKATGAGPDVVFEPLPENELTSLNQK